MWRGSYVEIWRISLWNFFHQKKFFSLDCRKQDIPRFFWNFMKDSMYFFKVIDLCTFFKILSSILIFWVRTIKYTFNLFPNWRALLQISESWSSTSYSNLNNNIFTFCHLNRRTRLRSNSKLDAKHLWNKNEVLFTQQSLLPEIKNH